MVKGACMIKGACVEGGCVWQGACMEGDSMAEGLAWKEVAWQGAYMYGRGHVWQEGMHAGETATEAGSMHPTGMYSCETQNLS